MKRLLSKRFYVVSHLTPVFAVLALTIGAIVAGSGWAPSGEKVFALVGFLMFIAAILHSSITWLVLLYKSWAAIQDGHARTTPARAVGFLFIPFFNFYWAFQAYWGLSKDYNGYLKRHSVRAGKLPEWLFLCLPLELLVSYLLLLAFLAAIVLGAIQSGPSPLVPAMGGPLAIYGLFLLMSLVAYVNWLVMIIKICDGINFLSGSHGAAASLYCVHGEFQGNSVPLPSEGIIIGRSASRAHLILCSNDVSAVHVEVRPDPTGAGVWVRDLQSTNGTYYSGSDTEFDPDAWTRVNGEKLLASGAHFRVGRGVAEFQVS